MLFHTASAGIERFFAEAAEAWAQLECDMGRIMTIAEKYGHHHFA
jgi:hypothetical protein